MEALLEDDLCPHCEGTGIEYEYRFSPFDEATVGCLACAFCNGSGKVLRCGDCGEVVSLVRPGCWQCDNPYCSGKERG